MEPVIPQDEYFEWEDIIAYQTPLEDKYENIMLQSESRASCGRKTKGVGGYDLPDIQHCEDEESRLTTSTSLTSKRMSLILDAKFSEMKSSTINFPSYAEFCGQESSFLIRNPAVEAQNYEELQETMDDIAISPDPLRHVDYLSHEWLEEDIWATWKRLVSKRGAHSTAERLKNASWRAWSKVRLNLKTVDPETFNWMKDLDDTWLYGPFHRHASSITILVIDCSNDAYESHTTLTVKKTRSILKKPRMSEVLLRRSDYIKSSRSKIIEVDSRPFFSNPVQKRVGFREDIEEYATVPTPCGHDHDSQDELDHRTETYRRKFDPGEMYDDPVEDLLSSTASLKHHVEENIKILENYRQQKPAAKLGLAQQKTPKSTADSKSSGDDRSKIANISPQCFNKPLCLSTLSEWTLMGEGFEEEDWIEPSPYKAWKPNVEFDITSHIRNNSDQDIVLEGKLRHVQINRDDQTMKELISLMPCEGPDLDPSSSDTSESHSSGSEDVDHDEMAYVSICDFPEERSEVGETRSIPSFHQMKQAFVDRVMDDYYISAKEDGAQDLNNLVPPDLIHPALKAA